MPARIDHVIAAAADLDQLEAAFTLLGFQVVGGGTHPHLGTCNRIIVLEQGYIELLAVADEQMAAPALQQRIATAPGWVGFVLQSADITAEADAMKARGADVRGPKPGRLVAPSGLARSWQALTVESDNFFSAVEPIPALLQHASSGVQHQQELAGADTLAPHPNGALRLQSVIVAVADLSDAEQAFAQAYGLTAFGPANEVPDFGADAFVLVLDDVDEQILLAQPLGAGLVNDRLKSAGEGVCCVVVATRDIAATRRFLQNSGIAVDQGEDAILLVPAAITGGAQIAFVADTKEEKVVS